MNTIYVLRSIRLIGDANGAANRTGMLTKGGTRAGENGGCRLGSSVSGEHVRGSLITFLLLTITMVVVHSIKSPPH